MLRRLVVCTFVLAFALPLLAEESPVKAGKWEITVEMEIPGMPVKMPPIKTSQCITEEQAADPEKSVPTGGQKNAQCQVKDMKVAGKTITYTVECPKEKMTAHAEMTYSDETFKGSMKMKADGQDQEITTKFNGKRLGDC